MPIVFLLNLFYEFVIPSFSLIVVSHSSGENDTNICKWPLSSCDHFSLCKEVLFHLQVTVYRLICKETVEEKILQRASQKNTVQQLVMTGGHVQGDLLAPEDVVSLLIDDKQLEQKLKEIPLQVGIKNSARNLLMIISSPTSLPPLLPFSAYFLFLVEQYGVGSLAG